jgi:hypothetical protein
MTKNWSVSRAFPGPIKFSHQPGAELRGVEAAWDESIRPVWRRMALSLVGERVPQVSYAMSKEGRGTVEYASGRA